MVITGTAIIGGIIVAASVAAAIIAYRKLKRARGDIKRIVDVLQMYATNYESEQADVKLINETNQYLVRRFPNGIEAAFSQCGTLEERREMARRLAMDIANIMNVDISEVEFAELGPCMCGFYNHDNKTIVINDCHLVEDPYEMVKTICHELKHAVQATAITDNRWGYSDARVAMFMLNWEYYVRYEDSYMAYVAQPIELDAQKFENEAIANVPK